jgi:CTP-dependent riboflavin kinase
MANKPYNIEQILSRGVLQAIQDKEAPPYVSEVCRELSDKLKLQENTIYKMIYWSITNGFVSSQKRGMESFLTLTEAGEKALKKNV